MKRNSSRSGSMQLSIEAIIILVIAIVLLGLGIAFIKNFLGQGTEVLEGTFDPIKEQCQTTSDNPILPLQFRLRTNEQSVLKVCVLNNMGVAMTQATLSIYGCVSSPAAGATIPITAVAVALDRDKSVGFKVPAKTTAAPGTVIICNIQVKDTGPGGKTIGPSQVSFTVE